VFAKVTKVVLCLFSVPVLKFKVVIIFGFKCLVYLNDDVKHKLLQYYAKQSTILTYFLEY